MFDDAVVLTLATDVNAPAVARRYVAQHAHHLDPEMIEDAELLVSELVTNAVRHGQPLITLRVSLHPPGIGVEVHDQGDVTPVLPAEQAATDAVGGRGLLIVAAVATSWGVTPSDPLPGKTIWFRLTPPAI